MALIADVDYEHQEMIKLINGLHDRLLTKPKEFDASAFLGETFRAIPRVMTRAQILRDDDVE